MPIELTILGWACVLGLVHILVAGAFATRQRGTRWNAGNREGEVPALRGAALRTAAASRNFMETFPLFAAVALALVVSGRSDAGSVLGAQVWFGARLLYLPIYGFGIPWVRSAVWAIALLGLLRMLMSLLV